jgi:putative DNA methylase
MATATTPRKKLIEVSIPLEAINAETKRRKQKAPKGYPTSFHKYWAQRPVAACRAVLFAQLVDDPGACPEDFPTKASQNAERDRLHRLIKRLISWDASTNDSILSEARYEIARSVARGRGEKLPALAQIGMQKLIEYLQEHAPTVYDPFSGAASIALEAQRLGLRVSAADLNPVAVLIGKALVEYPPKFANRKPINPEINELQHWKAAQGLAADLRYYASWVHSEAQKRIGYIYPPARSNDGTSQLPVIAWFWARTVRSPDPRAKGAHVPLVSSFVLSTKVGKEVIVKPVIDREKMSWAFEVSQKPTKPDIEGARRGTKAARGANFVCLLTGAAIDDAHVKAEGKAGRMGVALMAIVAEGPRNRLYLSPTPEHASAAKVEPPDVPEVDQPLANDPRAIWCTLYGLDQFTKLFAPRQLFALTAFSDLVIEARNKVRADAMKDWSGDHSDDVRSLSDGGLGPTAYAEAVTVLLSVVLARMALYGSSLCKWLVKDNAMASAIPQKSLEMTYDYVEGNPLEKSSSGIMTCSEAIASCLEQVSPIVPAQIEQHDAQLNAFCHNAIVATDPPYLDNVGYADLSDYFYVWHRRTLRSTLPELFRRVLTPKKEEIVALAYRHDGKKSAEAFFMQGMTKTLSSVDRSAHPQYPLTIFYAYKQSETHADGQSSAGWAAFLQALLDAGFAVDATWPLRTENTAALKNEVNALASSIVLVCRRRDVSASTMTRADFLRALRREMPAALVEIRRAGVGPTDIQQAAIGPGIGVFTRYAQVLNTDGTPILVRDALKLINQAREEIAMTGDADYDSETRFALDWFTAKGFEKGRSGDAIVMTNAVDLSLDGMNAAGFFLADGGVARLLRREELPDDWDLTENKLPTVWEACQHLIKRLRAEDGGIDAAAALYNRLGSLAEPAHALARRLYDICEQNQWAAEGYVYNQLHQEWDTIEKRAAALGEAGQSRDLFSR